MNKEMTPKLQAYIDFKIEEKILIDGAIEEVGKWTGENLVDATLLSLDLKKGLLELKNIENLVKGVHELVSELTAGQYGVKLTTN